MKPVFGARIAVYGAVCLLQLGAPLSMIAKRETTLREGTPYKFRTRPVDPYDAFRGKYVRVTLDAGKARVPPGVTVDRRNMYVTFDVAEDGFVRLGEVREKKPDGDGFLYTRVYGGGTNANVVIPFDRYYMSEFDAPAAETAYRKASRRQLHSAHVVLRMRRGFGVIEDLYIDDVPIREHLKLQRE